MNPDGSDQKRLTFNGSQDTQPCWSPDGTRIAWASNRTGDWDIWVMDADGTGQRNLTGSKDRQDTSPTWADDPNVVCFVSNKRFYLIRPEGEDMSQMFDYPLIDGALPVVTASGLRFAFRGADGTLRLKQGFDDNRVVKLTYGSQGVPKQIYNPSWSTDTADIVFDSGGPTAKIYIAGIEDATCDEVIFEGNGSDACFAKTDDSIVFTAPVGEGKGSDICIVDIDAVHKTKGVPKATNLTHTAGSDTQAAYWEPKVEPATR
jgi:Tol biopolymer transport system component